MSARALNWAYRQNPRTIAQKLTLLALADNSNSDGFCRPSLRWLAIQCQPASQRTVRRAVAELVEQGFLEKDHRERVTSAAGRSVLGPWNYRVMVPASCDDPVVATEGHNGDAVAATDGQYRDFRSGHPRSSVVATAMATQDRSTEVRLLGETKNVSPSRELSVSDIQTVYDYWRAKRQKTRANYDRISDGRRQKIRARLREFSVAELEQAVDGVGRDPWPERPRHDDITVIFRSRETVERFLEMLQPANGRVFKRRFGIGMTTEEILSTIEEGT